MESVVSEAVVAPLRLNLACGTRWLDDWFPVNWGAAEGKVSTGLSPAPITELLANLPQCQAYTDAQRLYNVYSDQEVGSTSAGWLSAADPYFKSRNLPVVPGVVMGYTVELDPDVRNALTLPAGVDPLDLVLRVVDASGQPVSGFTVDANGIWATFTDYLQLPVWRESLFISVTRPVTMSREDAVAEADQPISLGTATVTDLSSNLDGSPATGAPTVKLYQHVETDLRIPLRAPDGSLRDTTLLTKALIIHRDNKLNTIAGNGVVKDGYATFTGVTTNLSGLYECQLWACLDDGTVAAIFHVYINVVQTGLIGSGVDLVHRVRSRLMDDRREKNLLLGDFEFDTEEIIKAATSSVDLYNSTGRPTSLTLNNFPRAGLHALASGTMGHLLQGAAYRFARNDMRYQAGDVALDDQAKSAEYYNLAEPLLNELRDYANFNKTRQAITSRGAWGTY